mmetsp:Transcript_8949/g.36509  ORF Transcript_8949/g.36509 Transcript_8949/m.36509 type:complete len:220 (-) Transcript_8949:1069-1728(-)
MRAPRVGLSCPSTLLQRAQMSTASQRRRPHGSCTSRGAPRPSCSRRKTRPCSRVARPTAPQPRRVRCTLPTCSAAARWPRQCGAPLQTATSARRRQRSPQRARRRSLRRDWPRRRRASLRTRSASRRPSHSARLRSWQGLISNQVKDTIIPRLAWWAHRHARGDHFRRPPLALLGLRLIRPIRRHVCHLDGATHSEVTITLLLSGAARPALLGRVGGPR